MKACTLGYLTRISLGNVNASHTEGNVMVTKKVTLPDGTTLPYVSGQAIRRMLRDRLADLGYTLSEVASSVSGQEVTPPVRPWEFIDEDLFGYLDASGGRRRTSPVRTSAAIGCFPYQGDRDLGTRSFERFGEQPQAGGNMFETEVYYNVFRGAMLVEMDRVGAFLDLEVGELPEDVELKQESLTLGGKKHTRYLLSPEERRERVKALMETLRLLWGGGRTARMLVDFSPRLLLFAGLKAKHPVFLEALQVEYRQGRPHLAVAPLEAALERFAEYLDDENLKDEEDKVILGLEPGFLGNEEELARWNPRPIPQALEAIKARIDKWTP